MTDTQETNEFDRVKYLENLLKISQEINEELKATYKKQRNKRIDQLQKENAKLARRILEQQKTIGSLTDTIDELKAQIENIKRENEDLKTFLTSNIVNNTESYLLSISNES